MPVPGYMKRYAEMRDRAAFKASAPERETAAEAAAIERRSRKAAEKKAAVKVAKLAEADRKARVKAMKLEAKRDKAESDAKFIAEFLKRTGQLSPEQKRERRRRGALPPQ